jgi:hypothetical protein
MARQNRYVNDKANAGSLCTGYANIVESRFNVGLSWRCSHRDTSMLIDSAIGPTSALL